jgi:hypothetical protein
VASMWPMPIGLLCTVYLAPPKGDRDSGAVRPVNGAGADDGAVVGLLESAGSGGDVAYDCSRAGSGFC